MKNFATALFAAAMMLACASANAESTINPSIPASNAPLNSAPVRQNFQNAYNDINNILSMYYGPQAPNSPSNLQSWANSSGYPKIVLSYFNAVTGHWIEYATINATSDSYAPYFTSGFLATAPLSVTFPSGVPTFALNYDSNFAVSGGQLTLAPIAAGALLGNSSGSAAEPGAFQTGDGVLAALANPLNDSGGVLGTALASTDLFIGNASGIAAGVPMSGDATISNIGALTNLKVNGVAYPASPSTNTVPVVTSANQITYTGETSANTASTIMARDASGNSAANLITANQLSVPGIPGTIAPNSLALGSGGSGYAAGDTITLQCTGVTFSVSPVVGVNEVSGGVIGGSVLTLGGITAITGTNSISCSQASTTGDGTGATFTAQLGVLAASLNVASLSTGGGPYNGNLIVNYSGDSMPFSSGFAGNETTLFGDKAGGGFIGVSDYNSAFGHNACGAGGSGAASPSNSCFGDDAGRNMQDSASNGNNVLLGAGAGRNIAGGWNVWVGSLAGGSGGANTPGALASNNNVGIGFETGYAVTTGSGNLLLGPKAASSTLTTGSDNIILSATSGGAVCDTPASGTNSYFAMCLGAAPVFTISGGGTPSTSAATLMGALSVNGGITVPLGTLTSNVDGLNVTATWNNASTVFNAPITETITNTASNANSKILSLFVGGTDEFSVLENGDVFAQIYSAQSTADATSPTSGGAFFDAGGAGIAKSLWVGTTLNVAGATTLQNLTTAGIVTTTSGGLLGSEATITSAQCPVATTGANGCVKPDGTTITISGGVLTAVGAATTSIDAGGATSITNGAAGDLLYDNAGNVGHESLASLLASPPAIGGTAPAAAKFTTLGVTGSITSAVRTASSTSDTISATTDYMVCPDNGSAAATETLPSSPATGLTFLIKDCGGTAATHNITITPASGNIDGASTYVMSTAYGSVGVTYTGSQWSLN